MLPTKFRIIWSSGFKEDFYKSTNQKQVLPVVAMLVNGSERNQQSQQRTFHRCFLPSFSTFGPTVSEGKNLKNHPIRNNNRMWRPCLLMDRDRMNNLYREPSINASYQVSDHLAKRFQRRRLLEIDQSETRIALWWPCLLMDRDEMSNRYTGPPIDQFYKVQVHLAEQFQRRRILKIGQSKTIIACGGHVC